MGPQAPGAPMADESLSTGPGQEGPGPQDTASTALDSFYKNRRCAILGKELFVSLTQAIHVFTSTIFQAPSSSSFRNTLFEIVNDLSGPCVNLCSHTVNYLAASCLATCPL